MKHYRRIWIENYGAIPKDKNGRSYEIHHINGDHNDNRLDNLICITIEEHYNIHLAQKDYGAAFRIAQRMYIDTETKAELASLANKRRLEKGKHPFIDPRVREKAKEGVMKNIEKNQHGFQNKELLKKAIKNKKQKYSSEELSRQVKSGWDIWKSKNGDAKKRTTQGSIAGAAKTKGTKWYHKPNGDQLRTLPNDSRIVEEGWIKGRYNGKELSKNANNAKLVKKKSNKHE